MDRRKIVQIVRSPAGGIRKHILAIIENLDTCFDFILITDEKLSDKTFRKFKEITNIKVVNLQINDQPGLSDLVNIFRIYKIIYKENPHIVHGHGAKGGIYARICGWLNGCTTMYTAHGGSMHEMHGKLANLLYTLIEKLLIPFTNKFVFESEYSFKTFSRRIYSYNESYLLNRNAVTIDREKTKICELESNHTKIILGAFGLLRKIKGHDILIRSASLLIDAGYDIEVRIFGEGEEKENLYQLSVDLGINNILRIYDTVDNVELEMRECSFIVHPSFFESFGYVPVEALSLGVPVITSNIGGLKEIMNFSDLGVVNLITEYEFFKKIKYLIDNPDELNIYLSSGIDHIEENFNQEKFVENYKKIYLGTI